MDAFLNDFASECNYPLSIFIKSLIKSNKIHICVAEKPFVIYFCESRNMEFERGEFIFKIHQANLDRNDFKFSLCADKLRTEQQATISNHSSKIIELRNKLKEFEEGFGNLEQKLDSSVIKMTEDESKSFKRKQSFNDFIVDLYSDRSRYHLSLSLKFLCVVKKIYYNVQGPPLIIQFFNQETLESEKNLIYRQIKMAGLDMDDFIIECNPIQSIVEPTQKIDTIQELQSEIKDLKERVVTLEKMLDTKDSNFYPNNKISFHLECPLLYMQSPNWKEKDRKTARSLYEEAHANDLYKGLFKIIVGIDAKDHYDKEFLTENQWIETISTFQIHSNYIVYKCNFKRNVVDDAIPQDSEDEHESVETGW